MCGTEYDLVRRETLERYTPHRCAEKEQGFTHERRLAVYLFFSWIPPWGLVKKTDAVLWERSLRRGRFAYSTVLLSTIY